MSDHLPGTTRPAGDGWVVCPAGHRHWGRVGAAGLLLLDPRDRVLLQHRAEWSHHGGTWALPGGARDVGETALAGALRESWEEARVPPSLVRPRQAWVEDHGTWSYTTVVADAVAPIRTEIGDAESVELRWVPVGDVTALPLLEAFARMWARLRPRVAERSVLVVDAANVVGARPDGWWRDRRAATERLRDRLVALAGHGADAAVLGAPGAWVWPEVVLVAEGAARGVLDGPGVAVVDARGEGDPAILETAAAHAASADRDVTVVTADRELASSVRGVGARVLGPGTLWAVLDHVTD